MIFNLTQGQANKTPVLDENYPADVTINDGVTTSATFKVAIAENGMPAEYTYQWYVDDVPVDGATGTSFVLADLIKAATKNVYCLVTNKAGVVQSRTATLAVKHTLLYKNGTRYDDVTGGFKSLGIKRATGSDSTKIAPSVAYNSSKVKITISSAGSGMVYTANQIDCTNCKTLHIKGILYCHGSSSLYRMFAALWSSIGTYASDNRGASWQNTSSTQNVQDISIDISNLSGKYYIGFFFEQFGSLGSYIEISELWLEGK